MYRVILIMSCFLLLASQGHAGFEFVAQKNEKQKVEGNGKDKELAKTFGLVQRGSGSADKKTNFGSYMPLSSALDIIKPEKWQVAYTDNDIKKKRVSWRISKEPWTVALEEISKQGVGFVVDWGQEAIFVGERPTKEDVKKMKAQVAKKSAAKKETKDKEQNSKTSTTEAKKTNASAEKKETKRASQNDRVQVSEEKAPTAKKDNDKLVAQKTMIWEIEPGRLKPQFEKWAEKAKYELVWESDYDYEISVKTEFSGEFVEAVSGVIDRLYRGGTKISAKVYKGNNVLVVRGE